MSRSLPWDLSQRARPRVSRGSSCSGSGVIRLATSASPVAYKRRCSSATSALGAATAFLVVTDTGAEAVVEIAGGVEGDQLKSGMLMLTPHTLACKLRQAVGVDSLQM